MLLQKSIKHNKNKRNLICQINAYAAHKKTAQLYTRIPVYNFWDYFMKTAIKEHI